MDSLLVNGQGYYRGNIDASSTNGESKKDLTVALSFDQFTGKGENLTCNVFMIPRTFPRRNRNC